MTFPTAADILRPGALLICLCAPLAAAAQGAKVAPEIAACMATNKQTHADLASARDDALRRNALNAVIVTRLQALGPTLAKLRESSARTPRKLTECEQVTQDLSAAREQFERVVGSPEQVAECSNSNQRLQAELQETMLALQSTGLPNAVLQPAAGRVDALRATARDNPSLSECRQLGTALAEERVALNKLKPPPPPPAPPPRVVPTATSIAECRAAQSKTYNDVAQAYARVLAGGQLPPAWAAPLQALSERLTRLHAALAAPPTPSWDCDAMTQALNQARDELAQMRR